MPNPQKPRNLKLIAGTIRPSRDNASGVQLPLVAGVPKPPAWLTNAHAAQEFNRLATILAANRLLSEAGLSTLAMLCATYGQIVEAYASGEAPTGHLLAQYRGLANDHGLSPVAQAKLKPGVVIESKNPFTKFGKRLG